MRLSGVVEGRRDEWSSAPCGRRRSALGGRSPPRRPRSSCGPWP